MRNIFLLVLLFIPIQALSAIKEVTGYGDNFWLAVECTGLNIGSIYDSDSFSGCDIGTSVTTGGRTFTITHTSYTDKVSIQFRRDDNKYFTSTLTTRDSICAPPKEIVDGLCIEKPPFCESEEYTNLYDEAKANCDAEGGTFSASCDIETDAYSFACEAPLPCMPGSASWPACSPEVSDNLKDPTAPLDGIPSPNPDPITPSTPDPVDTPTGDDSGSNTDLINSMTSLNSDLNSGLTNVQNEIKQNGALITANNDLLVSQMEQSSQIYENNKTLLLAQTKATVGAIGDLGKTISELDGTDEDKLIDGLNGTIDGNFCSSFSCDGNAAMCYLAQKEWEQKCEREAAFGTGGAGESLLSNLNDWANDESRSKGAIYEDGGDLSDAFDHYGTNNGFSFDSGCPAPHSIQVMGADFTLSYQPFCDLAAILRVLIVSFASLFSVLMIVKYS